MIYRSKTIAFYRGGEIIGLKFIDFFAGIGGFRLGMERHGYKCVGWCEKDKFAQKSYRAIHDTEGEWFNTDITTVQPGELPKADVYCGGFPCQSFSIAGKRKGLEDIRGTLVFEVLRLAKERQPKYLFLENVKGLLSHDGGKTFAAILNAIHECGYEYTEWQVLNSKNFGVPQNRERVFIIGHLRGASTRKVFPIRRKNKGTIKRHQVDSSGKGYKSQNDRLYQTDGLMCCLPTKQTASKTKIIQKGLNTTEEGDSYCIDSNYHKGTSPGDINSGRRTHIKIIDDYNQNYTELFGAVRQTNANKALRNGVKLQIGTRIRKLTPKECWRLQGFPRIKEEGLVCYNNAKYVEKSLNTKEKEKLVPKTVHINYEGKTLVIHSQEKSFKFANGVEMKGRFLPHIKTEDFVVLSVGMLRTLAKTVCCGKKENPTMIALNTNIIKKCEKLEKNSSKIRELVNAVEKDIKRNWTSIPTTKKVLKTKNLDMISQILFYFVNRVMQSFISMEKKSLLKIDIDWDWAFERAKEVNSDTQLYRQAGNSVSVPVIEVIARRLKNDS